MSLGAWLPTMATIWSADFVSFPSIFRISSPTWIFDPILAVAAGPSFPDHNTAEPSIATARRYVGTTSSAGADGLLTPAVVYRNKSPAFRAVVKRRNLGPHVLVAGHATSWIETTRATQLRRRNRRANWNVKYSSVNMGELLLLGAFRAGPKSEMLLGSDIENMQTKVMSWATLLAMTAASTWAGEKCGVDYINPMVGASTSAEYGEGKTFPGAATPFGLVQLSPDTITGGDNGPGYSYEHKTIEGFSFTHMSGIGWYGDLGNFQVMPAVGTASDRSRRGQVGVPSRRRNGSGRILRRQASSLRHPGGDDGRPAGRDPAIHVSRVQGQPDPDRPAPPHWRERPLEAAQQAACPSGRRPYDRRLDVLPLRGRRLGKGRRTRYLYAPLLRPVQQAADDLRHLGQGPGDARPQASMRARTSASTPSFPRADGEQVLMKSGISFVSVAGAKANLEHDIPDWNFERACRQARDLWSTALEGLRVEGGTDAQREAFFTALYHCQIDPRSTSDVDGRYLGADNRRTSVPATSPTARFSAAGTFSAASSRC